MHTSILRFYGAVINMVDESMKNRLKPVSRAFLCVFLSVVLIVSLCVPHRKAQAFAPIVGGAAAAAALAAELGISVEALTAATIAVVGVGTGVAIGQNMSERGYRNLWIPGGAGYDSDWWGEYQDGSMNLPGTRPWDDLSDEEKQNWDSPKQYVQGQWTALWLEMGLLTENDLNGGGLEPTPEPEDPEEKKKWQKGRNILTLLGIGSFTVGAQEVSNWLADTLGQNLRNLLYGDNLEQSFDLVYDAVYDIDGVSVNARAMRVLTDDSNTGSFVGYNNQDLTNAWVVMNVRTDLSGYEQNMCQAYVGGMPSPEIVSPVVCTKSNYQGHYYYQVPVSSGMSVKNAYRNVPNLLYWKYNGNGTYTGYVPSYRSDSSPAYINALYAGVYDFGNGVYFADGKFTGANLASESYGQMDNTPLGLGQAINAGGSDYSNFMGAVQNPGNGVSNVVQVPNGLVSVNPDGTALVNINDFLDYLKQVPQEQVQPVPDDQPVVNPNPNPDPDPDPEPDPDPDETDFTEEVQRLLSQPFDQLFPFCLIGDLRRLLGIIQGAAYGGGGGSGYRTLSTGESLNGTAQIVLPLSGFGVAGLDDFVIDLSLVRDLGGEVRPFFTALFVTGLLVGTFRFFLNRGGE